MDLTDSSSGYNSEAPIYKNLKRSKRNDSESVGVVRKRHTEIILSNKDDELFDLKKQNDLMTSRLDDIHNMMNDIKSKFKQDKKFIEALEGTANSLRNIVLRPENKPQSQIRPSEFLTTEIRCRYCNKTKLRV